MRKSKVVIIGISNSIVDDVINFLGGSYDIEIRSKHTEEFSLKDCDIVLAGANTEGLPAVEISETLRTLKKDIPVIAISESDIKDSSLIFSAIKSGVADWINKDELYKIRPIVEREILRAKERKIMKWNLEFVREHSLLDLPNITKFQRELDKLIKRSNISIAVALIDISFPISEIQEQDDTVVIAKISDSILQNLDSSDLIAHIAGRRFAIATENIKDISLKLQSIRESINSAITIPFYMNAGISLFPADGSDSQTLIKNAEVALIRSKDRKGDSFLFYRAEMKEKMDEIIKIVNKLIKFDSGGEHCLFYQPIIDIKRKDTFGYEALLRIISPDLPNISIAQVLELAYESDIIFKIERWVLHNACAQAKRWTSPTIAPKISVNISAKSICYGNISKMIKDTLSETRLDPEQLIIEVTESVILENIKDSKEELKKIKDLGVNIAIDDFGSKYNSIKYLKHLPSDYIKISNEILHDVPESEPDSVIISAMIELFHRLGKFLIAEGVEREEQFEFLKKEGCNYAQGFLFSKPLPPDEIQKFH